MSPSFWHWWILAGLAWLVELLVPGFVALYLGLGAALTGLLVLLLPGLSWQAQLLAFTLLSLAAVAAWWWVWRRRAFEQTEGSSLNRRAEACIGRTGLLATDLTPARHARLRLGDTTWAAAGPPLPAGTEVRVVRAEAGLLIVEPAQPARMKDAGPG